MSRTEHRNETDAAISSDARRRRAALEERLAAALADGDAEMVSRVREALAELEAAD